MKLTRLILIRHGITDWNKEKRYCGYKDIDLSKEGKLEALQLRNKFKSLNFDRVYSSDRKRAVHTARIIFNGAKLTKLKDLREMNFGALEGLSHEEIIKIYPQVYEKWLADPFKNSIPKAEHLNSFKRRVNNAIKKIINLNPSKTIPIVSHGGAISIFLSTILKTKNFWRYIPRAASITIVEYKKGKPKIKLFNQIGHLR